MKLYLVSRTDTVGYDQYDAFVVAAHTPDEAQKILHGHYMKRDLYREWSDKVEVELIGVATDE